MFNTFNKGIGAPINGVVAFVKTQQLDIGGIVTILTIFISILLFLSTDKLANALALATSPVVRALFDFDGCNMNINIDTFDKHLHHLYLSV